MWARLTIAHMEPEPIPRSDIKTELPCRYPSAAGLGHTVMPRSNEEHIAALRLGGLLRAETGQTKFKFTEEETQHLRSCRDCQDFIDMLKRQIRKHSSPNGDGRR